MTIRFTKLEKSDVAHSDSRDPVATIFAHPVARTVQRYVVAVMMVGIAHVIVATSHAFIDPAKTSVFLAAVIIASLYGGRGPGVMATVLAALDLDYTFTPPFYSLNVVFDDLLWLIVFFAVALLTSSLQGRRLVAEESLRAAHRELQTLVEQRTHALVESQEQFRLLVNGMVDQAVFVLGVDGRIVSWNAGAERLLGYRGQEMEGRDVSAVWPPFENRGRSLEELAKSGLGDQGWVTRKDGTRFWGAILLTPLQDVEGSARGYAVAVRDVTERRGLEQEIVEISEREQQRIGHDLHDGLGQELTGIAMLATALSEKLVGVEGKDDAERVADLIHDSIGHTRSLARGLCPVDLEGEGLSSALRRLTERVGALPGMRCDFESAGTVRVDSLVASHLYRIAQEAMNNAMRHGGARQIRVALAALPDDRLRLSIADDGKGFAQTTENEEGLGLRLMKYRAHAIRGVVRIVPGETGGTVVECVVGRSEA